MENINDSIEKISKRKTLIWTALTIVFSIVIFIPSVIAFGLLLHLFEVADIYDDNSAAVFGFSLRVLHIFSAAYAALILPLLFIRVAKVNVVVCACALVWAALAVFPGVSVLYGFSAGAVFDWREVGACLLGIALAAIIFWADPP